MQSVLAAAIVCASSGGQWRSPQSRDYHPFDLADGRPLEAEEVGRRLSAHFDTLEQIATAANLSARSSKQLGKARRVLKLMMLVPGGVGLPGVPSDGR
jgi:hypothetical protein